VRPPQKTMNNALIFSGALEVLHAAAAESVGCLDFGAPNHREGLRRRLAEFDAVPFHRPGRDPVPGPGEQVPNTGRCVCRGRGAR